MKEVLYTSKTLHRYLQTFVTDLERLSYLFKTSIELFSNQKYLETETALLSRCIYRMKMKFRSDKGLKAMEKANRALLQYLRLNFLNTLNIFYETLPSANEENVYLPARDMLDYILVRLQGLSKLLCRVAECAQEGALYMENRIHIGHFWKVALICFGLLSRIWVLIKNIVAHCCEFYKDLLPYRQTLQNGTPPWLPAEYDFPVDLRTWLDVEWLDSTKISKTLDVDAYLVPTDDEIEFSNKLDCEVESDIEIINESTTSKEAPQSSNSLRGFNSPIIFETVSEVTQNTTIANIQQSKRSKKRKRKYNENKQQLETANTSNNNTIQINGGKTPKTQVEINSLNSVDAIIQFVKTEDMARIENLNKCVLKKLDRLQWNMLRKKILKVVAKSKKNKNTNKCINNVKQIIKHSVS